jgi:hypothetical protein
MKIFMMRLPSADMNLALMSPPITQQSFGCELATTNLADQPIIVPLIEDQSKSLKVLIVDDNPINLKVRGYATHLHHIILCCLDLTFVVSDHVHIHPKNWMPLRDSSQWINSSRKV